MIFIDRSPSLTHYGVLGMKWGIRKDGKPQGFQYGKAGNRITKKQIDSGEPIVIAKGSTVYRTSNKQANFMKRKNTYVDITPNKHDHEAAMENMDSMTYNDTVTFTMKTKRPIKIATFDDYYKTVLEMTAGTGWESDLKDLDIDEGLTFINRHISDGWLLGTTPDNYKYQNFERINKRLSDKGFDGVLDPEDARYQYENQSLDDPLHDTSKEIVAAIIFNPSDVLEIVNTEKPTYAPRGYYLNY